MHDTDGLLTTGVQVGEKCDIEWNLDTTGDWTDFSITLMTGSNFAMVPVQTVASGLDGTKGAQTIDYTCPDVSPNSAIYFYQFSQEGAATAWTTRFTIAAADGSTTKPTESTSGIAWGTGSLVGSSGSASSAAASGSSRVSSAAASSAAADASSASASAASTSAEESSEPATTATSTSTTDDASSSTEAPSSSSSSASSSGPQRSSMTFSTPSAAPSSGLTAAVTTEDSAAGRVAVSVAAVLGAAAAALVFA
ncbi:hypothetical protein DMC30DRAFT_280058 [Rhodotorula diobovata]|uniref:Yeast cell wall synthesis Kre9/Knh1-like N-terminal domain-containing protein n=1 Tax=Rhodotorula diobovata TaxID=5288 RepID=A0A5C5G3X4_9BASI|nr:hypothetical protein DMC30DRAFT_280058 [Rhodotorula diobovata]